MGLLFIKLTLTPLLMAAVSLASRRWGGAVGGLLAGLPLTAAPLSIYVTIEQGPGFTAAMAVSAICGIGAVTLSYLVYIEGSRRLSVPASIASSVLSYLAVAVTLRSMKPPIGLAVMFDCLLIVIAFARSVPASAQRRSIIPPTWDLPARVLVSTAMVLIIPLVARLIGPLYSGLLSTVPMIGWPLIVFAHSQQGRAEAVAIARGVLQGIPGLIAFYVILHFMLPTTSAIATFPIALTVSLALTGGWALQRRRRPRLLSR